jgi:hypothetical protein
LLRWLLRLLWLPPYYTWQITPANRMNTTLSSAAAARATKRLPRSRGRGGGERGGG